MSEADLRLSRPLRARLTTEAPARRRAAPSANTIARRRFMVSLTKWSLPLLAVLLLGSIAAWPELVRIADSSRVAFRRVLQVDPESGQMREPRYHGIDQRGRPYTVTATSALQTSPERIVMTAPKGDLITESGSWIMVQAKDGVYIQHQSLLDLSGDVTLYREEGTTLQTDTAAMDLKVGAGSSSDVTHAEGPFGTLDSQGFALVESGAVIQFQGPAHAVLNSAEHKK